MPLNLPHWGRGVNFMNFNERNDRREGKDIKEWIDHMTTFFRHFVPISCIPFINKQSDN